MSDRVIVRQERRTLRLFPRVLVVLVLLVHLVLLTMIFHFFHRYCFLLRQE
jgi:hypothetical protein